MSYSGEVLADTPVGYWRLGEVSGTTAADSGGGSHAGEFKNAPTLSQTGALTGSGDSNTAVKFNGTSQRVIIPNFTAGKVGDVFTVEAWIKREGSGESEAIFHGGTAGPELRLTSGKLKLLAANVAGVAESTGTVANDGNWHHVVVTKTGSTIHFYIDGVEGTKVTEAHTFTSSSAAYGIGAFGTGEGGEWFKGSIDEVAIYATALSEARVKVHFVAATTQAPSVTTLAAGTVTETSGLVKGKVNPHGLATTYRWEYGTTEALGSKTAETAGGEGSSEVEKTWTINALTPGTTYYFRFTAKNADGESKGEIHAFTTVAKAPVAATHTASLIADVTAVLNGGVNPEGSATNYWFEFGTTEALGSKTSEGSVGSGSSEVPVEGALSGLTPNTKYFFRVSAESAGGLSHGLILSFTTEAVAPPVNPIVIPEAKPRKTLSVRVTTATGESYRWAPDEWDYLNIPQSLSFSTAMPGGFDTLSVVLPRRIDRDYPDLNLLDNIEVLGAGNQVAWEGRVVQLPRSLDEVFSITVGAVGWSSHLMDDPSFREIYVDRELGNWKMLPTAAHSIALRGASLAPVTANIAADPATGLPTIELVAEGNWAGITPIVYPYYDAGPGLKIAKVYADWTLTTSEKWNWKYIAGDDGDFTGANVHESATLAGGPFSGHGLYSGSAGAQRCFGWKWWYTESTAGLAGAQYVASLRKLAVFGNHGLPLIGPEAELGVSASSVIEDVLHRAAPLLQVDSDSIEETTFPIPQLAFKEATTAHEVIEKVNAYHLWEWGVFEDRKFFFREPNSERLCWEARLSDGAKLDLEGTQVADIYNGVVVQFSDASGESKTAGPIGSGCDYEDGRLEDSSSTNVINEHGIPRKWAVLSLSIATTNVGAIQIGQIYLGEKRLPQRRGTMTLTGYGFHPTAGPLPVWRLRAGDWVRVGDHPADEPRRIIATSYDADSDTISLTLDNTSQKIDAIIEWVGVQTAAFT